MPEIKLPDDFNARVQMRQAQLQRRFDATILISSKEQRAYAEALLARIGTVDRQSEGYASPENQRDLSIKFHWGRDHRFCDDLSIRGRMGDRHLSLMAQFLEGFGLGADHFAGRRVLDVGCWTGGTTRSLKMMGAAGITALEEVRKYADAARVLTGDIYGHADVICRPASLYDFEDGQFDRVYMPGVVYHLSDPVLGLRRLYNRLVDGGDILVDPRPTGRTNRSACSRATAFSIPEARRESSTAVAGTGSCPPRPACFSGWKRPVSKRFASSTRRSETGCSAMGYAKVSIP
jgi:SAM-dependent methyltransferase